MMPGNGQLSVPPGFRFHPTDEELLYYYLKKKVSYEAIDLDVIREVDLNKLEPWDLKEKCRIGSGPQNEWYFFSHKDKKYPTGTRTNRATAAGFWKATGRDKAIYMGNAKRIGMRKTLVFYTGRAPHGQKTDWIMHEYRLDDDDPQLQQEDGWVVCRVFKKKNYGRGYQPDQLQLQQQDDHQDYHHDHHHHNSSHPMMKHMINTPPPLIIPRQHNFIQPSIFPNNNNNNNTNNNNNCNNNYNNNNYSYDHGTMHLPQLSSPDNTSGTLFNTMDNLLRLTSSAPGGGGSGGGGGLPLLGGGHGGGGGGGGGEWGFLDKLLASYQSLEQHQQEQLTHNKVAVVDHDQIVGTSSSNNVLHHHNKFPFHYLGSE